MVEPLVLVHGEDPFLVGSSAQRVRAELCQDLVSDLGLDEFRESTDLDAIERSLDTPPFLAVRRVVMIWDPPQLLGGRRTGPDQDRLLRLLEERLDTTAACLVVRSQLAPNSAVVKRVRQLAGEVRLVPRPKGRELWPYVQERVRERGLELAPQLLRLLVDVATQNLGWLEMELDKLELYREDRQPVGEEEGSLLVSSAPPTAIYRLTDALFQQPESVGTRLAAALGQSGVQPQLVVGALARLVRDLLSYADPGADENPPAAPSWVIERLRRQLARVGSEQLVGWLVALSDLDWRVRCGSVDAREGLEVLLAVMANDVAAGSPR